jgi:hypothetical protein
MTGSFPAPGGFEPFGETSCREAWLPPRIESWVPWPGASADQTEAPGRNLVIWGRFPRSR